MRTPLIVSLMLITGSILHGADVTAPLPPRHETTFRNLSVSVPKLAKAPTLDGTIDPNEWAGAGMGPRLSGFEREDRLMDEQQKFYWAYTDDALWLAWQIQRPKDAVAPKAIITEPDKSFWRTDDGIEFMLNPRAHSKHRKTGRDFYMVWNALGTKYDRRENFETEVTDGIRWNGNWETKSRTVPDFGWEGEARFPLSMLEGHEKPGPGVHWIFQICENRATPEPLVATAGYQISWFEARDYPTMLFTGADGVFVRVLDSGAMAEIGKGGAMFEIVNPGSAPRTVVPKLRFYKRKPDAPSSIPYLRAFDQARDRPEDRAGQGKVALFIPDEQVSQQLIDENFTPVKELKDPITLAPGQRQTIDVTTAENGDYLLIYDVRYAEGQAPEGANALIAGGPLAFILPEPLAVATRNFLLVDKSIEVKADLRYVSGWDTTSKLSAVLAPSNDPGKALFQKQWTGAEARTKALFDLPIKDVAPGRYTLSLVATDASAKALRERKTPITIPETPEWFSKPVGQTPVIPKTFQPIQVAGAADAQKLSFLMGDYQLKDSVLPSEIRVRSIFDDDRQSMLRAPVRLHGVVDGKPVEWTGGAGASVKVGEKRDEIVKASTAATAGNVTINQAADFEYDGMEKITLDIAATDGQKPKVSQLTLSIPFVKGFADLYRPNMLTFGPKKVDVKHGTIPAAGVAHDFHSGVWIGNTRRGLDWFAENMRGWYVGGDFIAKTFEVENGRDGVTLNVHFIRTQPEKALVLEKPRQIIFGLMATPPRTINPKAIRYGIGHYDSKSGHAEKLDTDIAAGMNAVEVWVHHKFDKLDEHLQGWPDQSPEYTAQLAALNKPLRDKGIRVTPYSGWFLSRNARVYPTWGAEMVVDPLIDGGLRTDVCCWNTPVTDAYLWQMRKAYTESGFDGFRMDAGFQPSPCSSLKHRGYGSICGWHDDAGNLRPSYPVFGAREAAKRAYRMHHGGDIAQDGLCASAIPGVRYAAILSHMDAALSSEGAEMAAHSSREFDISFWRANLMEDRYGLQLIYGPKGERLGWDTRLGLGAIHRLTPRYSAFVSNQDNSYSRSAKPGARAWHCEDWVGWLQPGTEFYGYWENRQFLTVGQPNVYGSFHVRRGEKLYLALFNHNDGPVEVPIKLDLKGLGFDGTVYAIDGVLDEPIAIKPDGTMSIELTAESLRLVKISSKPFDEVVQPKKISEENVIAEADPAKWPAQGVPQGWTINDPSAVSVTGGEIVIQGKPGAAVVIGRSLPLTADKHYVMEIDARLDAKDGTHLGPNCDRDTFAAIFGGVYFPRRSISSESLPGRYQTLRMFWSPTKDNNVASVRTELTGDGQIFIRRIGIYEVDRQKPLVAGIKQ